MNQRKNFEGITKRKSRRNGTRCFSKTAFILSFVILTVVSVRINLRIFGIYAQPIVYPYVTQKCIRKMMVFLQNIHSSAGWLLNALNTIYNQLPQWSCILRKLHFHVDLHFRGEFFVNTFTVLGLVNFSYPFIVSTRNTCLYGVQLADVMFAVFPWHGVAYIIHALLVILGLYCGRMGYILSAIVCMFGTLCSMGSTISVAIIFVFRQDLAIAIIEKYLNLRKMPRNTKKKIEKSNQITLRMLQSGDYIHAYFNKTQEVPAEVVQNLITALGEKIFTPSMVGKGVCSEEVPFMLYTYSSFPPSAKLETAINNEDQTVATVVFARAVCERIFEDLDDFKQASLLRQMLFAIAESLTISSDDIPLLTEILTADKTKNRTQKRGAVVFLCGVAAYFRSYIYAEREREKRWENWERLQDKLLAASVFSSTNKLKRDKDTEFRFLLKMLNLLLEVSTLVEAAARKNSCLEQEGKFWKMMILQAEKFDLDYKVATEYFSIGQSVMIASGSPDFDPEGSCLRSFHLLWRLKTIQKDKA